jgi:hypothetical protein
MCFVGRSKMMLIDYHQTSIIIIDCELTFIIKTHLIGYVSGSYNKRFI